MATLKDVAKDAGVSVATVSCCLSGNKPVKPETRMRIMDSIEKLKYIPNISARNLKSPSTRIIGIVLTDIDNQYHTEIFKGLSSFLQSEGYSVSVAFSGGAPDMECSIIDNFISLNVAGLLIATCQPQNTEFFRSRILNYNIPAVFVERQPQDLFVNFAGFDNYETTRLLTNLLLEKGYQNIALACGPFHFSSERECIDGYRDALLSAKRLLHRELICNCNLSKEDAFRSVLTSISAREIDAIIATSDNIASGAVEALSICGLEIPGNITLVTFSEESWNTRYRLPGVLYTSREAFQLGSAAARLLLENIQAPLLFEPKTVIFHDRLSKEPPEMPPKTRLIPKVSRIQPGSRRLKALMVDLATAHSLHLLSDTFTEQTGIQVDMDFLPQSQILERISGTIDSKETVYDIYMYDIPWLSYMVQNSLLADITDYVTGPSFHRSQIFPENLENCLCNDRFYGIPIVGGSQIMFYRKDLFERRDLQKDFKKEYNLSLRPPKTWTEFNGTCRFFTRAYNPKSPTEFGASFAGITEEELAPEILLRIWAYGGALYDSYNRPCLNTTENAKAFESILETLRYTGSDPFQTSINQTVEDFSKGKTAMLITYTEYASQINKAIHNNIIGRVGYEMVPGRRPASVGWNMGLNPGSASADLAFRYFTWLCRHDTSFYMTILDGQSPVIAPYHSQELIKLYPWMAITEKSFNYTQKRVGPHKKNTLIIPQNKIERILCNVLKNVLLDHLSIPEALNQNQKRMQLLFSSYGYPKPFAR
ncbi:MAG: extracellular solute-binding protein [Candidatus Limivivens sp.]|nr:extracellular solute-binding protein [Candidatus Limivivens sp.]